MKMTRPNEHPIATVDAVAVELLDDRLFVVKNQALALQDDEFSTKEPA